MKFTLFMERLKRSNQKIFASEFVRIKPCELERLLRCAFDAGMSEAEQRTVQHVPSPFESLFGKK